jgi:hypothetical protein
MTGIDRDLEEAAADRKGWRNIIELLMSEWGKRRRGRTRVRWLDAVEQDAATTGAGRDLEEAAAGRTRWHMLTLLMSWASGKRRRGRTRVRWLEWWRGGAGCSNYRSRQTPWGGCCKPKMMAKHACTIDVLGIWVRQKDKSRND